MLFGLRYVYQIFLFFLLLWQRKSRIKKNMCCGLSCEVTLYRSKIFPLPWHRLVNVVVVIEEIDGPQVRVLVCRGHVIQTQVEFLQHLSWQSQTGRETRWKLRMPSSMKLAVNVRHCMDPAVIHIQMNGLKHVISSSEVSWCGISLPGSAKYNKKH